MVPGSSPGRGAGLKAVASKKLLVRALATVIPRKGYGCPQGHHWLGAFCI
jgi:hypothetical protein